MTGAAAVGGTALRRSPRSHPGRADLAAGCVGSLSVFGELGAQALTDRSQIGVARFCRRQQGPNHVEQTDRGSASRPRSDAVQPLEVSGRYVPNLPADLTQHAGWGEVEPRVAVGAGTVRTR